MNVAYADATVTKSFAHCRSLAKAAARNFYYGFVLLPPAKRDALCALYAFMRHADDISDSETASNADKSDRLSSWRSTLDGALAGNFKENRILPAFHHTVKHYAIPAEYFHDLIAGALMDLEYQRYPTFNALREYCYRVAGTVGLCCTHVFGFRDPKALELAEKLGIAFQLTNILRDVPEDYRMGRIYLPQEDLARFGCSEAAIAGRSASPALVKVMKLESDRAWQLYDEGVRLQELISEDSRAALWTLTRIYSGILRRIETLQYDVLAKPRPGLSRLEKASIMLRAGAGLWKPGLCPRQT